MIKIDLGEETSFEVTYLGKVYELREPTVSEIDEMRENAEGGIQTLTKFLSTIGMPEDVIKTMPMSKAKRLIDALMEELTKKK